MLCIGVIDMYDSIINAIWVTFIYTSFIVCTFIMCTATKSSK